MIESSDFRSKTVLEIIVPRIHGTLLCTVRQESAQHGSENYVNQKRPFDMEAPPRHANVLRRRFCMYSRRGTVLIYQTGEYMAEDPLLFRCLVWSKCRLQNLLVGICNQGKTKSTPDSADV